MHLGCTCGNFLPLASYSTTVTAPVSANYRPRRATLAKPALGIALAMGVLTTGQAQAFVLRVTVNSLQYDVITFTGSYNTNISKFETAANSGVMPWWGSATVAQDFATAVGAQLGSLNSNCSPPTCPSVGPLFAYEKSQLNPSGPYSIFWKALPDLSAQSGNSIINSPTSLGAAWTYAQATLYTPPAAPVPGPLPALGAAAAFGFSRKLRNRIKHVKGANLSAPSV